MLENKLQSKNSQFERFYISIQNLYEKSAEKSLRLKAFVCEVLKFKASGKHKLIAISIIEAHLPT